MILSTLHKAHVDAYAKNGVQNGSQESRQNDHSNPGVRGWRFWIRVMAVEVERSE